MSDSARPRKATLDTHYPRTIAELGPGDHVCCLYKTEEKHRTVLTSFLRQGLERGEKVLYIVDAHTAEAILGYLRDDGLHVEPYLARGQLVILTQDESYTQHGIFDPDGMIALLRTETDRALAQGYPALRVTGEMSWALRGLAGSKRLIEYEAKLNKFFPGSDCLAICQYDQRAFTPAMLLDVLRTHPIAVVGTTVYDNFYYVPPLDFLSDDPQAAQLRHWLEHLAERKRITDTLAAKTQEYIDTTNLTGDIIVKLDKHGNWTFLNDAACRFYGKPREELLGTDSRVYLNPEDMESTAQVIRETRAQRGSTRRFVNRQVTPMGVRVVEWDGYPLFDDEGRYAGAQITGRDITERKRMEEDLRKSEARYRLLAENTSDLIWTIDLNLRYTYISPAIKHMRGYSVEEMMGTSITETMTPASLKVARETLAEELAMKRPKRGDPRRSRTLELEVYCKDGSTIWTEMNMKFLRDSNGKPVSILGVTRDISERKRAEEALRQERDRATRYLGVAEVMLIAINTREEVILMNQKGCRVLGYKEEEIIGKNWFDTFLPARTREEARSVFQRLIAGQIEPVEYYENPVLTKSGEERLVAWHNTILTSDEGSITASLSSGEDITERKRAEEERERLHSELELRAITDSLTGLYDHTHFYQRLAEEINRSKRYKHSFALLLMDVDNFKRFNESRGHQVGDEMLRLVADCIRSGLRRSDIAFRYGGDEFAAILPHADPSKAETAVDRMNRRIAKKLRQIDGDGATLLTLTAGVACFPDDGATADELVTIADATLYNAKWVARARDIMGQRADIQSLVSALVSRQGGAEGSAREAAFRPEALHEQQARIVSSVASSIAVALKDAGVIQALEDPDLQVLATVGAAAEIKDRYIRGHPERMSAQAVALAEEMGLSPERVTDIRIAALLHDIGKVTVSEGILNKPGKLTKREFANIKDHPIVGATLVSQVKGFDRLAPIVRHHHERFDGTGYPDGLAGEDIPLEARILSVLDVFDALTHERAYRKAESKEEAMAVIERGVGTQFDPAVVKAFTALVNRQGQKRAVPKKSASGERPLVAARAADRRKR